MLRSPKRFYCYITYFPKRHVTKTAIIKSKGLKTDKIIQHWLDLKMCSSSNLQYKFSGMAHLPVQI